MITRILLRYASVAALLIAAGGTAFAQDPNEFERVLLPIMVGHVPGGYGTVWSTELWYRNNGVVRGNLFPMPISDYVPPPVGVTTPLAAGNFPADTPGTILFITRAGADDVQFDLRLFNEADPRGNWGTKIPVVRDTEFHQVVSLINIPTSSEFRSALRIYGLPDGPLRGQTVRVRVYSNEEKLLASTELPFEGWPLYAQVLSLADAFPEIREVDRVRVRIESTSGPAMMWAFVAVVSNTTQTVSIITPD
jgi:hypothetical protein